jgi:hypothetical protein
MRLRNLFGLSGTCASSAPGHSVRPRPGRQRIEGADENGEGGVCLLDTLCTDQVIGILKVDERARADLIRVTSDPTLLDLAETVDRLPSVDPGDQLQKQMGANHQAETIPFYAIFRGQPPFAQ